MKINWQDFQDPSIQRGVELMRRINSCTRKDGSHYEAYIVGGSVRDIVKWSRYQIGSPNIHDIDLATNMPIPELQAAFPCESNNGEAHGTILVFCEGEGFEVTQFRTEEGYSDGRHPDKVERTDSFEEDTKRRDFTINAMGIDADGNVIDFHNGIGDLDAGILRTVGNPDERFGEDGLRIIRAMRFAARFGMKIDPETMESIRKNVSMLNKISIDRIYAEFMKSAEYGARAFASVVDMMIKSKAIEGIPQCAGINWKEALVRLNVRAEHPLFSELDKDVTTTFAILFVDSDNIDKNMHNFRCTVETIKVVKWIAACIEKINDNMMDWVEYVDIATNPNLNRLREVFHSFDLTDIPCSPMIDEFIAMKENFPVAMNELSKIVIDAGVKPGPEFGKVLRDIKNWAYECMHMGMPVTAEDIKRKVSC